MCRLCIVFFLIYIFTPITSLANNDDKDLWLFKIAGIWSDNNKYGFYRAKVFRHLGRSRSSDVLVVEIIEKNNDGKNSIIKSVSINFDEYKGVVENVMFKIIDDHRAFLFVDLEMRGMKGAVLREVYIIDHNGDYKRIVEAKYVDFD